MSKVSRAVAMAPGNRFFIFAFIQLCKANGFVLSGCWNCLSSANFIICCKYPYSLSLRRRKMQDCRGGWRYHNGQVAGIATFDFFPMVPPPMAPPDSLRVDGSTAQHNACFGGDILILLHQIHPLPCSRSRGTGQLE